MSLLVSDVIQSAQQELNYISGTQFSDEDVILFLNRANKYFYTTYLLPTCVKTTDLLVYQGVPEYPLPTDFDYTCEPRRPFSLWSPVWAGSTERSIYRWNHGNQVATKFYQNTPVLVISDGTLTRAQADDASSTNAPSSSWGQIDTCGSLTDNGPWAISGDGSSLIVDNAIYSQGLGSFRFTITASTGQTVLTNPLLTTSLDFTGIVNTGKIFLDIKPPSTNNSKLTSIQLRIGSDASNYYQMTPTVRQNGQTITTGWGLVGFDLTTKTTVGSPDVTALDYLQITINHGTTSAFNGQYHIDNIFYALPTYYELPYYSNTNITSSGGTLKTAITLDSDIILVPFDLEEAFIYKALELMAMQRLRDATVAEYFRGELAPKEKTLKSRYPKQTLKPAFQWFKNSNLF
jgi:hypothetical protein